jgi:oligosaccharide translocation protein RFT1
MAASHTDSDDLLFKSSFSSASSLVALQLFSRLFTFVLNQALFRLASPRTYGTVAIQFELMLSTILFISREGVRNTLLRVGKPGTSTSGLSILPISFGIPLALATSYFYAFFAGPEVRDQRYFNATIGLYAIAAVTELMSEPLHNLYVSARSAGRGSYLKVNVYRAMAELRTNVRVTAEGLGIAGKTLTTFLILLYDTWRGGGTLALLSFAGGQLAYGLIVLLTYLAFYGTGFFQSNIFQNKYVSRD